MFQEQRTHIHDQNVHQLLNFQKLFFKKEVSKTSRPREFPAGLVGWIPGFHCCGPGSIPVQEIRSHQPQGATKNKIIKQASRQNNMSSGLCLKCLKRV